MPGAALEDRECFCSAAIMNDTRSVKALRPVDVQIRRYQGVLECDVVVAANGRELVVTCPDYNRALRWALMECKSYRVTPRFSDTPSGVSAA